MTKQDDEKNQKNNLLDWIVFKGTWAEEDEYKYFFMLLI